MSTDVTAACLGAVLGGALIWALETWVFTGGVVPDAWRSLVDWVAPLIGAALFGLAAGLRPHGPDSHPGETEPGGHVKVPPQRNGT